jgi:hypothetical protein
MIVVCNLWGKGRTQHLDMVSFSKAINLLKLTEMAEGRHFGVGLANIFEDLYAITERTAHEAGD